MDGIPSFRHHLRMVDAKLTGRHAGEQHQLQRQQRRQAQYNYLIVSFFYFDENTSIRRQCHTTKEHSKVALALYSYLNSAIEWNVHTRSASLHNTYSYLYLKLKHFTSINLPVGRHKDLFPGKRLKELNINYPTGETQQDWFADDEYSFKRITAPLCSKVADIVSLRSQ